MILRAQIIAWRDRLGWTHNPADSRATLAAIMSWLAHAQDASGCDGISAYYDLRQGRWAAAYPETTGYAIPTFFDYAALSGEPEYRARALRMADWETSIQLPDGAIQAGTLDAAERVPTVFNTGQVLFGWARAYRETRVSSYAESLRRAADWLLACQDSDGAWRRFPSPYASGGINAYNTRTAFGLVAAAEALDEPRYVDAARRNVAWALSHAHPNGWLPDNCLEDSERPLTHTIAYSIRGILEVSVAAQDEAGLERALMMARAVARSQRYDGALPGRLDRHWAKAVSWTCVTGNAQMAIVWLRLAHLTQEKQLATHAASAIEFCMNQVDTRTFDLEIKGAVKGSTPFDGGYMRYRYPNWAAKFLADAIMLHLKEAG